MFSKDSSNQDNSNSPTPASPRGGMPSIVSPDLRVQGDLTSSGDIQVEGIVDGGVFCRQVTIGEFGSVTGAIESESVHVSGCVEGKIRAKSVILTTTARVEGDISYENLSVEAGAQLKGRYARQSWAGGGSTPGTEGERVRTVIVRNAFLGSMPSPIEPASVKKMAYPLPNKPSIAVLPFNNLSGDPNREYFSDGMTEQIINSLSKVPNLFVIARSSMLTYKGKSVKVQKVAEDLGVKYVLEGSVQKASDRIQIITQLIDATTGQHVWSERYDRDLEEIFAVQDNITLKIMNSMSVELLEGEQARIGQKHETSNLEAYKKVLQARQYTTKGKKQDSARALQLYEESIALDPEYARAYAGLGLTHFLRARFGWSESPAESIKMAFKYAQRSIELDDTLDIGHILLSSVYVMRRQYEKAIAEAEHAISLNPNGADAYSVLGGVLGLSGRWEESVAYTKKSIRLNPFPMVYYFHWLGRAYFMTGQYNEAIATWKKALRANSKYLLAHTFLAACYSSIDRQKEAAAEVEEVLSINPKFSLASYVKTLPYKNQADKDFVVNAMRKAGLPK
jgi:adenylate cyclase